jgi:periplasmic protein TonB
MRMLPLVSTLLLGLAFSPAAAAQSALDEAKAQYASAAYEDALASLTRATGPSVDRVELEQYRVLCLIALGRMADAERAVAAIVEADPKYAPSPNIASPRVLSLVAEMRKKALPAAARRLFDSGKRAFQQNDFGRAHQELTLLLQLLNEESMQGRQDTADLRVLAEGFVVLAAARAQNGNLPDVPARASGGPALQPNGTTAGARSTGTNGPLEASETATANGAPPAGPSVAAGANGDIEVVKAESVTEPIPVLQQPPAWIPPNAVAASREYVGAVRVRIGADGRVTSATIEQPTYPSYDARLLQVARQWLYKPATRNGEPVESERVIPIQLRPRQ